MALHQDFLLAHNDGFSMSTEMMSLQVLARCTECIGQSPPEFDDAGKPLTSEQAANLQWIRCGQCRCGTHDWFRR
jgi:hypothetical protein